MDTGARAVGPFTELVEQYGPRVWDTLSANVPRDLRWNWLLLMLAIAVLLFFARKGRGAKGADGGSGPVASWSTCCRATSTRMSPRASTSGCGYSSAR